jgi:hypothetical protein
MRKSVTLWFSSSQVCIIYGFPKQLTMWQQSRQAHLWGSRSDADFVDPMFKLYLQCQNSVFSSHLGIAEGVYENPTVYTTTETSLSGWQLLYYVLGCMHIPNHFDNCRRPSPGAYSMSQVRKLRHRWVGTDFTSYSSEALLLLFELMRGIAWEFIFFLKMYSTF